VVRGRRKARERKPLVRLEAQLLARTAAVTIEVLDQLIGGVAELADVELIGIRIVLGAAGHRRTAEYDRPAVGVRARDNGVETRPLHVQAGDEDRIGPSEVVVRRRA